MSNTSKGKGIKGSKFWIQTIINSNQKDTLNKALQDADSGIGEVTWLSPLAENDYCEIKTKGLGLENYNLKLWKHGQPSWDAVGRDHHNQLIFVEAKGHIRETYKQCKPFAKDERRLVFEKTFYFLTKEIYQEQVFNDKPWLDTYYQTAVRLAFLANLKEQGALVKLIFLNFINDSTYKPTTEAEWQAHYNESIFKELLGINRPPDDVIVLNYDANIGI